MIKILINFIFFVSMNSIAADKAALISIEKEIFSTQQKVADSFVNLNLIDEKIKILEYKIQLKKKIINQRIFAMAQLKKINWANPLVTSDLSKADRNLHFFNEYK